ncbi:MAG: methyltransferase domain-containing protein [Thermoanaerobaculia bacterium]|nr:methyltransferase domain-containing protein [Thermoanaerobaculia bacterium]
MLAAIQSTARQKIIHYFEGAGLDYYYWDKAFNMHFGYYKPGMNPFDRSALLHQMNREVMNRLRLERYVEPLVLDLGCGLGAASRFMAKENSEAQFSGFTITPWQVNFGNQLTREEGLGHRLTLYESDFAALPLGNESAEAAFALESACYAKGHDKAEFAREVYRVLKPGGCFVVADGFRKHSRPLPGWLDKVYRKNMDCWALTELADIHLFTKALQKAGFRNIRVEDISWRVAPSFAHIPFVTLRFYWDVWQRKEAAKLDRERKNNALAPALGMIMGASRKHFSYYLVSGEK